MIDSPIIDLIQTLPTLPGTYLFKNKGNIVIYIGKAKNIRKRVSSYFVNYQKLVPRLQLMVDQIYDIQTFVVNSEVEALILEASLIKKYKPKFNILLKDDKNYCWIKITKDPYPIVYRTRSTNDKNAIYFGPFTNSKIRDKILSILRKNFPFRTCKYNLTDEDIIHRISRKNSGEFLKSRLCTYYHIGLCGGPCEGLVDRNTYLENIKSIKNFLRNKHNLLLKELELKMRSYAENLEFEKAAKIKMQIQELEQATKNLSISYGDDEDDVMQLSYQRSISGLIFLIRDLKIPDYQIFNKNYKKYLQDKFGNQHNSINIKELRSEFLENFRIECFDISNLQGTNSVGSMVVFEGGIPLKSDYRKFKIKSKDTPDDFQMMREILMRRLSYLVISNQNCKSELDKSFIKKPNLIILDGGKGQLNVGLKVLNELGINDIFICSLAKKREEIFIPGKKYGKTYYKQKETLFLLQRIRDEAHRFGLKFHRYRRSKQLLES